MQEVITINLNGSQLNGRPGMTVLELARENGVNIPTLCYDRHLKPHGACRVCLVEDEASGKLLASCVTPLAPGMSIATHSQKVIEARRTIVELLLASHNESCLVCDKGNRCELRTLASNLGVGQISLNRFRRYYPPQEVNPFIERDLSKCILCGKCIRGCQELHGIGAIDYAQRGFQAWPETSLNEPLEESNCTFCGLCVELCPVGALTERMRDYPGREERRVRSVCPWCNCGCSFSLLVRGSKIIGVEADIDSSVNEISLCAMGKYGFGFVNSKDRLKTPLVRKGGKLVEATWDDALELISDKFSEIKEAYGPGSIAILGSAKISNEASFLLQKFARAVIGTNNIDNIGRLSLAPASAALSEALGIAAMTNSIADIERTELILVVGADLTVSHPLVGYAVKRAVKQNTKLVVIDPRQIELVAWADLWLQPKPGADTVLVNGLIREVIEKRMWNQEFVDEEAEGFESLKNYTREYNDTYVQETTGISISKIKDTAKLYALSQSAMIIVGTGLIQQPGGKEAVSALTNLALLTGNFGKRGAGVNPVGGQNNAQGACDMGVMPGMLPGYQNVTDARVRRAFEEAWKVKLLDEPGLSTAGMMKAACEGEVKAMLIVGGNPVGSLPGRKKVQKALSSLEFLVVADLFLNETAAFADVVLPASSFAEQEGTFTSVERRVQRFWQAIDTVGDSKPDWQIITKLSNKMGYPVGHQSPKEIMKEISRLAPIYKGSDYEYLEERGQQWPSHEKGSGSEYLTVRDLPTGRASFVAAEHTPPLKNEEYPLVMVTERLPYHLEAGTMVRKGSGFGYQNGNGFLKVNVRDAKRLKLRDNSKVSVISPYGQFVTKVKIERSLPEGLVALPVHADNEALNNLNLLPDDLAESALNMCAVKVEKASSGKRKRT